MFKYENLGHGLYSVSYEGFYLGDVQKCYRGWSCGSEYGQYRTRDMAVQKSYADKIRSIQEKLSESRYLFCNP